jgi:FlaA1/EpsC-like NDP-sugar epimerase
MSEEITLQTEFSHNSNFFEEIIGRSEVPGLSATEIQREFSNERILVIGAGGTIGSAISRKLINSGLREVYFLDRDESALHNLALSLSNEAASHSEKCVVADIKDLQSISQAIAKVSPTTVLHAAALKHLVMLERFPREGFITNVIGTLNVLEAANQEGVQNLINISTDKAANPSSILGMTKKITEVLVEEYAKSHFEVAASVRFGNVFASRGSVIETFIHQLKNGLPITITDENVARFFMSHNEAANLVLSAATIREKGTFVQNMGEEVKISEVVFSLARWLNVQPRITYVGLQNGEKLHEELFDGPVVDTKFPDIVRLKDSFNHVISEKMREGADLPNEQMSTFLSETLKGIYA